MGLLLRAQPSSSSSSSILHSFLLLTAPLSPLYPTTGTTTFLSPSVHTERFSLIIFIKKDTSFCAVSYHPPSSFSRFFLTSPSSHFPPRMIAAAAPPSNHIAVSTSSSSCSSSCCRPRPRLDLVRFGLRFRSRPLRALSVDRRGEMEWIRRVVGVGCFNESSTNISDHRALKTEEDSGGVDVLDAAVAAGDPSVWPDHLVVMVNGIVGSSADWKYAAEQFVKKLPDKVIVHRSECNYSKLTFDGVDLMGERLAAEVLAVVKHRSAVRKISFVAHSLGGLVARYAIARLYKQVPANGLSGHSGNSSCEEHTSSTQLLQQAYENRIAGLEPMNFITFATPHLGSRGHKQLPFLCGLPFLERRASQTAHLIAGRTGKHLFLNDNDDGKPPLLLQMVNDSNDLRFISALRTFRRRVAYANANYDHMVGWRTSSIRRQHELPKSNLLVIDQKYPHIVYVERETIDNSLSKASPMVGDQTTDFEEVMIKGLTQVPWERVDVSFHKSKQRYIAHSTIQVKTYWLNSDGADVVLHMIDNFLL